MSATGSSPTPNAQRTETQGAGDVWVFGYGSLMWRPDFEHGDRRRAHVLGWHRSLCILSHRYRGTPDRPGLVLGLDRGGSCVGVAFAVPLYDWERTKAKLHARELISGVYRPRTVPATLDDGTRVQVYAFVADRAHPQYWRGTPEQAAMLIRQGVGVAGAAHDYLARTRAELAGLGIADAGLDRLQALVDGTK